jgi:hypothetical protein
MEAFRDLTGKNRDCVLELSARRPEIDILCLRLIELRLRLRYFGF